MKIAIAAQEYLGARHGGIGTQTDLKVHGLAARGHEVFALAHSLDGHPHEFQHGGARVIQVPGFDDRLEIASEPVRWLSYSLQLAAALVQLHREVSLDLVEFPEWGCEGYVHLMNRTPWNTLPSIVQLHGPLVMFAHTMDWPPPASEFYRLGTTMEGACLRLADAVYSSSRCSAEWCARSYGLQCDDIPILHAGIDTHHFWPGLVAKDDRPTILYVGRLVRNKGVALLLEAACRLAEEIPGLRLRMLGTGEPAVAAELERRAAATGREELLELAGFVRHEDLPRHLCRGHVCAAPSVYEGGPGFVHLEAMACGLPVIGCAGSGVAEIIRPGENGLLIPPGDLAALVDALRLLLADGGERTRMGAQARQYVLAHADSRTCIDRIEALYIETLRRSRLQEVPA